MIDTQDLVQELQIEIEELNEEICLADKEILLAHTRLKTTFLNSFMLAGETQNNAMRAWLKFAAEQQWEV